MAGEPPVYVLDSFALLAYLEGEAGMKRVHQVLEGAEAGDISVYMSLINLGEVLYITERERGLVEAQRALAAIDQLPLHILPVSRTSVLEAAHIKARYPIAYADAFAVVSARTHSAVLLTGDPEFQAVANDKAVSIEWLPRR